MRLPGTGFEFPAAGEVVAWSRILDAQEALVVVNPNGEARRGGDIVVSAELSPPGTRYEVVACTTEAAAGGAYTGTHRVGSTLPVRRNSQAEPAFLELRDIAPAETIVLLRRPWASAAPHPSRRVRGAHLVAVRTELRVVAGHRLAGAVGRYH